MEEVHMKKFVIVAVALLYSFICVNTVFATNAWTQKADFGGGIRACSFSFSIGSKGYAGGGVVDTSNDFLSDFWEYDPSTGAWTQKADTLTGMNNSTAFSIGNIGYVGTGSGLKTFMAYDPATNAWTQKADFGGTARNYAVGFSIGNKGYIGTGNDGDLTKDFWEYDPATDTWTQKADFGGSARDQAAGFSIGSKGYIGLGRSVENLDKDFWEYDPATDAWTQKADFGGVARALTASFSIGSKGYVGMGVFSVPIETLVNALKDLWEYDPATDTWTEKADFGGGTRTTSFSFSIGAKGYIGTGMPFYMEYPLSDFWEFDPAGTGTFRNDSFASILWRNETTSENMLWRFYGTTYYATLSFPGEIGSDWKIVGAADFDGDGQPDILWRNETTGENVVQTGEDFVHLTREDVIGSTWQIVGVADFNCDGKTDILWRNETTGATVVWYMDGTTYLSYAHLTREDVIGSTWKIVGLGDFNGDSKPDILWRNETTGATVVWYMNGVTYLSYAHLTREDVIGSTWKIVGLATFVRNNNSGTPNILWRNETTGANVIWLMDGVTYISYAHLSKEDLTGSAWKVAGAVNY